MSGSAPKRRDILELSLGPTHGGVMRNPLLASDLNGLLILKTVDIGVAKELLDLGVEMYSRRRNSGRRVASALTPIRDKEVLESLGPDSEILVAVEPCSCSCCLP